MGRAGTVHYFRVKFCVVSDKKVAKNATTRVILDIPMGNDKKKAAHVSFGCAALSKSQKA